MSNFITLLPTLLIGALALIMFGPVAQFGAGTYPGGKAPARAALLDSLAFQAYAIGLEVAMAGCDKKPATSIVRQ